MPWSRSQQTVDKCATLQDENDSRRDSSTRQAHAGQIQRRKTQLQLSAQQTIATTTRQRAVDPACIAKSLSDHCGENPRERRTQRQLSQFISEYSASSRNPELRNRELRTVQSSTSSSVSGTTHCVMRLKILSSVNWQRKLTIAGISHPHCKASKTLVTNETKDCNDEMRTQKYTGNAAAKHVMNASSQLPNAERARGTKY